MGSKTNTDTRTEMGTGMGTETGMGTGTRIDNTRVEGRESLETFEVVMDVSSKTQERGADANE